MPIELIVVAVLVVGFVLLAAFTPLYLISHSSYPKSGTARFLFGLFCFAFTGVMAWLSVVGVLALGGAGGAPPAGLLLLVLFLFSLPTGLALLLFQPQETEKEAKKETPDDGGVEG